MYVTVQRKIAAQIVWLKIENGIEITKFEYQARDWEKPRRMLTYNWSGAGTSGTSTTLTPTIGSAATCTVTASGATGNISASVTVYRASITLSGNTGTDAATIANAYGKVGDNISIAYVLGGSATNNTLNYSGVTTAPASITTVGSGTSTYAIAAGDATSGAIAITATFVHTNAVTASTINGTTSMMLTASYAALSTSRYTISGTTPVTITKVSGKDRITWNNTTRCIDIAAGLPVGEYEVKLLAINAASSYYTFTFLLTVVEMVYYIDIQTFVGGSVSAITKALKKAITGLLNNF